MRGLNSEKPDTLDQDYGSCRRVDMPPRIPGSNTNFAIRSRDTTHLDQRQQQVKYDPTSVVVAWYVAESCVLEAPFRRGIQRGS